GRMVGMWERWRPTRKVSLAELRGSWPGLVPISRLAKTDRSHLPDHGPSGSYRAGSRLVVLEARFWTTSALLTIRPEPALPQAVGATLCLPARGLEQFDWIAVRVFQLNLFAARTHFHVVPKMNASLFQHGKGSARLEVDSHHGSLFHHSNQRQRKRVKKTERR